MKKALLAMIALAALMAAPAKAADLARPAPVYVAPAPVLVAVYSWSGIYIGINAGGAWGKSNDPTTTVFSPVGYFASSTVQAINSAGALTTDPRGFIGGAQAGFNWQSGSLVAGLEGDFNYFGLRGSSTGTGIYPCCSPATFAVTTSVKADWLATIRGRLGIANNNWLFYVTGGAAFTSLKGDFTFSDNCGNFGTCNGPGGPNAAEAVSISNTKAGWTVGGGIEAGLSGAWTVKAEYLYVDFGSVSAVGLITTPGVVAFGSNNNPFTHSVDLKTHILRLGLNYRFGGVI
jgi:outer membrane immunogenic protein